MGTDGRTEVGGDEGLRWGPKAKGDRVDKWEAAESCEGPCGRGERYRGHPVGRDGEVQRGEVMDGLKWEVAGSRDGMGCEATGALGGLRRTEGGRDGV